MLDLIQVRVGVLKDILLLLLLKNLLPFLFLSLACFLFLLAEFLVEFVLLLLIFGLLLFFQLFASFDFVGFFLDLEVLDVLDELASNTGSGALDKLELAVLLGSLINVIKFEGRQLEEISQWKVWVN